ncbi:hypothetical protein ACRYCC_27645 [Actinomadura scrupuli]|uniref:hypothetical protein n=1 Tax=Actinomadura scrupuli TaxID=559629 RepID=UPI003D9511C2
MSALVLVFGQFAGAVPAGAEVGAIVDDMNVDGTWHLHIAMRPNVQDPITKITAQVTAVKGGAPVPDVTGFTQKSTLEWVTIDPLPLTAYGSYRVTILVTNSAGTVPAAGGVGQAIYQIRPAITFANDRDSYDFDHKVATVTATVTGTWPDTGETRVVPNYPVDVHIGSPASDLHLTTDSAGHVSFSVPLFEAPRVYLDSPGTDDAMRLGDEQYTRPAIVPADTRISATITPDHALSGGIVTLTGKLEYLSTSGWRPLAGGEVIETGSKFNGLTTDADGAFSTPLTLDGAAGQRDWTLDFNRWQPGDKLFFNAAAQTTVHAWVTAPTATAINNFKASLDTHSRLAVSGDLAGPTSPAPRPIVIERSNDGRTGWTTVKTLQTGSAGHFAAVFPAASAGYWRARFAGDPALAPSVSATVYAKRIATRIITFKASPTTLRKGRYFTLTGVLQHKTSSWTAYGKQNVTIGYRFKGSGTWHWIKTAKTDTHGRFTIRIKASKSAYWAPAFGGATGALAAPAVTAKYISVR